MNKHGILFFLPILLCQPFVEAQIKNDVSIIVAAGIRDIANPVAGRYGELKTLVNQERAKNLNTFFLYGGGAIGPSALSNLDKGSHIIDILNTVESDAMGVYKREFSFSSNTSYGMESVLKLADKELYKAKNAGRNRCSFVEL